jgi:hypothetical protein
MRMIVLFLSGVCILFSSRAHAMNGGDWYRECSQWRHTSQDQMKLRTPEKILAQRTCLIEAIRIFCNANYEGDARLVSRAQSDETRKQWADHLGKFCPSLYPLERLFPPVYVLAELEKEGGPGIIETYAPASWLIERVFKKLFKDCPREREKLGLFQQPKGCLDDWVKYMDEGWR